MAAVAWAAGEFTITVPVMLGLTTDAVAVAAAGATVIFRRGAVADAVAALIAARPGSCTDGVGNAAVAEVSGEMMFGCTGVGSAAVAATATAATVTGIVLIPTRLDARGGG